MDAARPRVNYVQRQQHYEPLDAATDGGQSVINSTPGPCARVSPRSHDGLLGASQVGVLSRGLMPTILTIYHFLALLDHIRWFVQLSSLARARE